MTTAFDNSLALQAILKEIEQWKFAPNIHIPELQKKVSEFITQNPELTNKKEMEAQLGQLKKATQENREVFCKEFSRLITSVFLSHVPPQSSLLGVADLDFLYKFGKYLDKVERTRFLCKLEKPRVDALMMDLKRCPLQSFKLIESFVKIRLINFDPLRTPSFILIESDVNKMGNPAKAEYHKWLRYSSFLIQSSGIEEDVWSNIQPYFKFISSLKSPEFLFLVTNVLICRPDDVNNYLGLSIGQLTKIFNTLMLIDPRMTTKYFHEIMATAELTGREKGTLLKILFLPEENVQKEAQMKEAVKDPSELLNSLRTLFYIIKLKKSNVVKFDESQAKDLHAIKLIYTDAVSTLQRGLYDPGKAVKALESLANNFRGNTSAENAIKQYEILNQQDQDLFLIGYAVILGQWGRLNDKSAIQAYNEIGVTFQPAFLKSIYVGHKTAVKYRKEHPQILKGPEDGITFEKFKKEFFVNHVKESRACLFTTRLRELLG